jgi:hypothetical protein
MEHRLAREGQKALCCGAKMQLVKRRVYKEFTSSKKVGRKRSRDKD